MFWWVVLEVLLLDRYKRDCPPLKWPFSPHEMKGQSFCNARFVASLVAVPQGESIPNLIDLTLSAVNGHVIVVQLERQAAPKRADLGKDPKG